MNLELSYTTAALARWLFGQMSIGFLLLKVTAILGIAFLVDRAMQRFSAAQRHFVWSLALGSVLVLTLLTAIAPPIRLGVHTNSLVASVLQFLPRANPSTNSQSLASHAGSFPTPGTFLPPQPDLNAEPRTLHVIKVEKNSGLKQPPDASIGLVSFVIRMTLTAYYLWLAGVIFMLARLANAHRKLWQLVRRARVITDRGVLDCAQQIAERLQLTRFPRVLMDKDVRTPSMAGWLRPIVLLPESSLEWTQDRLNAVLSHEFAHVSRNDYLTQLLATIACAVYWFHPAVWIAARRLRNNCERAADDCAIATIPAMQYANDLLAIAGRTSNAMLIPTVALGLSHPSQLERRIRSMLNAGASRRVPAKKTRRLAGLCTLCVLAPLSALRVGGSVETLSVDNSIYKPDIFAGNAVATDPFTKPVTSLPPSEAAMDSVVDRTIDVEDLGSLNLNVQLFGEFVFHRSSDSIVRARAVLPKARAIGGEIRLFRTGTGVEFYVGSGLYPRDGKKDPRYEIWLPANVRLYVPPTSANTLRQLKLMGIKNVTGVQTVEIDGPVSELCASVILAHLAGGLRGRISCGHYATADARYTPLSVRVNGKLQADTVEAFNQSTANPVGFEKVMWDYLPLAQYNPDSVVMSLGTETATLFYEPGGRRKLSAPKETKHP